MAAAWSSPLKPTVKYRRTGLFALVLSLAGYLLWTAPFPNLDARLSRPIQVNTLNTTRHRMPSLGVPRNLYMLSLPSRTDRRARMEILREALGLNWTCVDALESTNELTQRIWEWVMRVRQGQPTIFDPNDLSRDHPSPGGIQFAWPDQIDQLALSSDPIDFWGETVWSTPITVHYPTPYQPTVCAMDNYHILDFNLELREHLILTRARIACWYSHLSVLHNIANNKDPNLDNTYIILEDDIDVEKDISQRIQVLWKSLPSDWDMVFLGHCWSDEEIHPPLENLHPEALGDENNLSLAKRSRRIHHLHPSFEPKCTHAYAVSKRGARRLLLHLRYPPFAYSRAIDQAISWLIKKGRIQSYTVVPSLVIQTKQDHSDIAPGTGSNWSERLVDGVLAGLSSV